MPRLLVEPLDPDLRGGARSLPGLALWGAALALVIASTGDGLAAAVLAGAAAADALAGSVAVAAVLVGLARFGTTSLAALAGAQAVLGPAVVVSPGLGALASALAALALVAAAPVDWRGLPFALLAGLVVVGPAAVGVGDVALRLLVIVLAVGLVAAGARWWPPAQRPPWLRWAALGVSGLAVILAVAA